MRRSVLTSGTLAAAVILGLTVLFWWFRIVAAAGDRTIGMGIGDLYTEHIPTISHTFHALRAGRIPLWNPYQFCGSPFLAQGWTGAFYPPRLINLFVDVLASLEILLVFHLFLGALGMWALAMELGLGTLAGVAAGTTFVWSYWPTMHNTAPAFVEALAWMPLIVLMQLRVLDGKPLAWLGLIATLACQLLVGLFEVTLHTAYVVAIFTVCHLVSAGRGPWTIAARRVAVSAAAAVAAALLSMPNTLPMIELVGQSARAAGSLTFLQTMILGITTPFQFLRAALGQESLASVGILPAVALPLALARRRHRAIWVGCILASVAAMLLCLGGYAWELYYAIPVVGSTFRRPLKFLNIFVFAQAMIAAVAVAQLSERCAVPRRTLWRDPAWVATVGLAAAAVACAVWLKVSCLFAALLLGTLIAFGTVRSVGWRRAAVLGTCVVQAGSLFFTISNRFVRPFQREDLFARYDRMLDTLQSPAGNWRVYLSPKLSFDPGLTPRQGTLREMEVVIDYEPLATGRYATFFDAVVDMRSRPTSPFMGYYSFDERTRWSLMDLTGTRYFVMTADEAGTRQMQLMPLRFRPLLKMTPRGHVRVFMQSAFAPRVLVVPRARVIAQPSAVLAALATPGFDFRHEVLLEETPAGGIPPADAPDATGTAGIVAYAPEEVRVTATLSAPGFLLLNDAFYPGWEATVDGRPASIHRANYLFRAVRLEAGTHDVRFRYNPWSFRLGVVACASTAAAIAVAIVIDRRRRRRLSAAPR